MWQFTYRRASIANTRVPEVNTRTNKYCQRNTDEGIIGKPRIEKHTFRLGMVLRKRRFRVKHKLQTYEKLFNSLELDIWPQNSLKKKRSATNTRIEFLWLLRFLKSFDRTLFKSRARFASTKVYFRACFWIGSESDVGVDSGPVLGLHFGCFLMFF